MVKKKNRGFFVDLYHNASKRKKKKISGGGCQTVVEAQTVFKTLAAIRQGYLSWWL